MKSIPLSFDKIERSKNTFARIINFVFSEYFRNKNKEESPKNTNNISCKLEIYTTVSSLIGCIKKRRERKKDISFFKYFLKIKKINTAFEM